MLKIHASTVDELFENSIPEPNFGCWLWLGSTPGQGYAYLGKAKTGGRAVWEIANKDRFPTGFIACHSCDVKSCVNPSHIYPGTKKDNGKDAVINGRHRPRGPSNHSYPH